MLFLEVLYTSTLQFYLMQAIHAAIILYHAQTKCYANQIPSILDFEFYRKHLQQVFWKTTNLSFTCRLKNANILKFTVSINFIT